MHYYKTDIVPPPEPAVWPDRTGPRLNEGRPAYLVVERLRHADSAAGEVGVVVLSVLQLDAGGRVAVARQQVEQVVLRGTQAPGEDRTRETTRHKQTRPVSRRSNCIAQQRMHYAAFNDSECMFNPTFQISFVAS